jgi:intracellular sulfur oxidation DsrE/DsrF family protein
MKLRNSDNLDLKKQVATIAPLRMQLAKAEADLVARRNEGEVHDSEMAKLKSEVNQLTVQVEELGMEKRGLESTIQKLWHLNAPKETQSMLKTLAQEEESLKVLNRSRQEDQQRYVQAKSDLSTKLEQNKRMQETSTKLAADNKQLREELEKMKASKDADENAFAEQLVDLQKKINDTEALLNRKNEEIKEASERGAKLYAEQSKKTHKTLQEQLAAEEKAKTLLEAKIMDLSDEAVKRKNELAAVLREKTNLAQQLSKEQEKLTYAVDKENSEMLIADKLSAEKSKLATALKNQTELVSQLQKLKQQNDAFKALSSKLATEEKNEKDALEQAKREAAEAAQKVLQARSKLDFAVDKENTEMMAVRAVQSENKQLRMSLANQTQLETKANKAEADVAAKNVQIDTLKSQNAEAKEKVTSLTEQVASLQQSNGMLKAQYIKERKKFLRLADQESTESLALKVLRGEKQTLKEQLKSTEDEEAQMAQAAKAANEGKTASLETLETERFRTKRDMARLQQENIDLEHKNGELQETVAMMAAKGNKEQRARQLQDAGMPENDEGSNSDGLLSVVRREEVEQPEGLQKASFELSKLEAQLKNKPALRMNAVD